MFMRFPYIFLFSFDAMRGKSYAFHIHIQQTLPYEYDKTVEEEIEVVRATLWQETEALDLLLRANGSALLFL
jgi:hypothetical protein